MNTLVSIEITDNHMFPIRIVIKMVSKMKEEADFQLLQTNHS